MQSADQTPPPRTRQLLDIPVEVIINVLGNFSSQELIKLRRVCKYLGTIISAPELWRSVSLTCSRHWTNKDQVVDLISRQCRTTTALHVRNVRDDVIEEILPMSRNLQVLKLHKWTTLSDHAFTQLGREMMLPHLRCFELVDHGGYYTAIGASTLYRIADAMPNLEELHIWCNALIDPVALRYVIDHFPKLKALSLSSAQLLHDEDIHHLQTNKLRYLNLSHCRHFTDTAMMHLAQFASDLETLVLHGANNVTDDGMLALGAGCRSLQHIKLFDCKQISLGVMDQIGFESVLYTPTLLHRPCFKVGIGFGYRRKHETLARNESACSSSSSAAGIAIDVTA
ncbi:hypothetical protein RI367_003275 [Sorochytrium milnesiophthora]